MASIGCRHDPLVVRLVKVLVNKRMMKAAMNPVDAEISEADEQGKLREVVPTARAFFGGIVELAISSNIEEKHRRRQEGHGWHCKDGLLDLEPDLVLEEPGMFKCGLVENEEERERCEDEIQ